MRFAAQPVPLHAVYELELADAPAITVEDLEDSRKVDVLITHTYRGYFLRGLGQRTHHFDQTVSVARSVRVRRVTRPRQRFLLDELVQVLEDNLHSARALSTLEHDVKPCPHS